MIQTIAIYGIVLFFCFVLARNAQKYEKKGYIVAIVLLLTLLAGLRKDSVGIDTHTYAQYLNLIRNGQFNYVWGVEYTFKMIMRLFGKAFKGYTAFLLSMALITNACIIRRLWDFRNITRFEWTVLVYYIMFYFYVIKNVLSNKKECGIQDFSCSHTLFNTCFSILRKLLFRFRSQILSQFHHHHRE